VVYQIGELLQYNSWLQLWLWLGRGWRSITSIGRGWRQRPLLCLNFPCRIVWWTKPVGVVASVVGSAKWFFHEKCAVNERRRSAAGETRCYKCIVYSISSARTRAASSRRRCCCRWLVCRGTVEVIRRGVIVVAYYSSDWRCRRCSLRSIIRRCRCCFVITCPGSHLSGNLIVSSLFNSFAQILVLFCFT
jgi:hypothetical protein